MKIDNADNSIDSTSTEGNGDAPAKKKLSLSRDIARVYTTRTGLRAGDPVQHIQCKSRG
jgi:hypothetical protein